MGLSYLSARTLWEARLHGAAFDEMLTVAHLSLNLHPAEVAALQRAYRERPGDPSLAPLAGYVFGDYADDFFRTFLGASSISILDYSAYEGATIVHDLNLPVPEHLWNRFDAVVDAGSLEHVFNFPVAIASLMRMLKVGGRIFLTTPANNYCGHGFYQFSPELMFRLFSPDQGFAVNRVALVEGMFPSAELVPHKRAYQVVDPIDAGGRVGLVNHSPVLMLVDATKIADVPAVRAPLQSDYVAMWHREGSRPDTGSAFNRAVRRALRRMPAFVRQRLQGYRERRSFSFSNTRLYRRLR